MKGLVEQTVKDPEKARQVQTTLEEIVAEVKRSTQQTRGFHEQLYALNADYQAKPEQFTKVLDDLNNSRMQSATKILGMRFKIKGMLTAQEWKDLTEGMEKARSRYAPKAERM
jgi:predicted KAP-like P-loop ATPase